MAIYEWQIEIVSRAEGRSTVAKCAYNSAAKLEDSRTGEIHDFRRKRGIDFSAMVGWSDSREALWNTVEFAEKRDDSRLAREIVIAIPNELSKEVREALMLEYAQALHDRWGVAVDFSIHKPHGKKSDQRNVHAHILLTTRTSDGKALGKKIRVLDNQRTSGVEIEWARKSWEDHANAALRANGFEAQIDCRSLKDKGIDRDARVHLGHEATALERRGIETAAGNQNRMVDVAEELARLNAETAAAKKREAEILAEMERSRDNMILESRRRLKIYEPALAAGAPKRREFSLDDFLDHDQKSERLQAFRRRQERHQQTVDGLKLSNGLACWLADHGLPIGEAAKNYLEAKGKVDKYGNAIVRLTAKRQRLAVEYQPKISAAQERENARYKEADDVFTAAVNSVPDLRATAAMLTQAEKLNMAKSARVPVKNLPPVLPPPKEKQVGAGMALRPRPGW